ncbi:MAG: hypothetical protein ACI4S2_07925 [Lachnospiraceae bacterium]
MKSKNLVICDQEEGYAQALAAYFTQKRELMLQVYVCSSPERVIALEEEIGTDLLLISEEYEAKVQKMSADKICVLATGIRTESKKEYPVVYKYQSAEKILAQLTEECGDWFDFGTVICKTAKDIQKKIIGVFSPVHRIGKTTYALSLGEKLAESENVLYLNLELFGGLDGHFEKSSQTIADVIYFTRQEKGNLGTFLSSVICHRGNLDYVAPVSVSEDIKEIKSAEWISLTEKILRQSIYETLILDLDEGVSGLYQILEACTEIHMPLLKDTYAEAKIRQFEQEIRRLGKEHIVKRIIQKEVQNDYGRAASFQNY